MENLEIVPKRYQEQIVFDISADTSAEISNKILKKLNRKLSYCDIHYTEYGSNHIAVNYSFSSLGELKLIAKNIFQIFCEELEILHRKSERLLDLHDRVRLHLSSELGSKIDHKFIIIKDEIKIITNCMSDGNFYIAINSEENVKYPVWIIKEEKYSLYYKKYELVLTNYIPSLVTNTSSMVKLVNKLAKLILSFHSCTEIVHEWNE